MVDSKQDAIALKLSEFQLQFQKQLPSRLAEIEQQLDDLSKDGAGSFNLTDLHRSVHNLVGSAGTFHALEISAVARELEVLLSDLEKEFNETFRLSEFQQKEINKRFSSLKSSVEKWRPTTAIHLPPNEDKTDSRNRGSLVFVVDDDHLLLEKISTHLEQIGYDVRGFSNLSDFETACVREAPSVIIMDMVLAEGTQGGVQGIKQIKQRLSECPMVIFISVRRDIEARLAAAREGAIRYFSKPLDMARFTQTLDGLTARVSHKPFRILLIDDEETLLDYYATILESAGMDVCKLSDPMKALEILESFKPDLVMMDVYMPNCTGPELAQVIRQDDSYAQMPIMFLSTETDFDRQLKAMDLGGDDFLTKPMPPDRLVAAVLVRAKRARWIARLNRELKSALRESEFRLHALDKHAIVSFTDAAGNITFINDKFCEISGFSRHELMGRNHRLLKSGIHGPEFYQELWDTISHGNTWQGIICNRRKDGTEYWVDSTIVPFLDEDGVPYQYVSARTDITELRGNEERLKRSQYFANIGTWDWNVKTGALYWSERIGPLFGYEEGELETSYENFIAAVHPDDRELVTNAVKQCVENGDEYNIEHRIVWPDGSIHWVLERGDVVRTEAGEALHMLGVVQDITERKHAELALVDREHQLLVAKEEAEKANCAKSEFLSSMSHELRTPMNAILGFGQLLEMGELTEIQQGNVKEILKAGEHLLALINEVLDLSKIESGRIELSLEPVGIEEVVNECLSLMSPLAEKNEITIYIDHGSCDSCYVRADHIRLKQAVLNLLSNSIKYNNPQGEVFVGCELIDKDVRICIRDTGPGVSEKNLKMLFTPFSRLGAEQTDIEGTGIGLVITKSIVEMMGGSIGIDTTEDVGSTFWISLPCDKSAADVGQQSQLADASERHLDSKRDYKIIYIEDNPANLRLVTQLLGRRERIRLHTAHTPVLGLDLIGSQRFDLILLDIHLPGMNGYSVLEKIRENTQTKDIPVIAISANAMKSDIDKGVAAGFDAYLSKPIDIDLFYQTIDKLLSL